MQGGELRSKCWFFSLETWASPLGRDRVASARAGGSAGTAAMPELVPGPLLSKCQCTCPGPQDTGEDGQGPEASPGAPDSGLQEQWV